MNVSAARSPAPEQEENPVTDHARELAAAIAAVTAGLRVARERIGAVRVTTKSGVDVAVENQA
jgi:hypothetical protein